MDFIKRYLGYLKILNTKGFWAGFIVGLFYFSYIFWWFWDLYPLDSLGLQNKLIAAILIFAAFLLSVSITAIFWGLFGFLSHYFYHRRLNEHAMWILPFTVAGIFTLLEYLRSIFFSIIWYGNGGLVGPYWPFGNIAYWTADLNRIASTASIWGIYGINFFLAWTIVSLALIFLKKNQKVFILHLISAFITILILNVFYDNQRESLKNSTPIPVSLIQTNVPSIGFTNQEEALEDFKLKLQLLEEAAKVTSGGIMVFPESTNFTKTLAQLLDSEKIKSYFGNLSDKEIFVFDSIRSLEGEYFKSKSVIISSLDGIVGYYDKQVLTPGGEFLPYLIKLPLTFLYPPLKKQFEIYREYAHGSGTNLINLKGSLVSILVCSELISPQKARQNNADYIVIMGSFSIWRGGKITTSQALAMTRFRAIENGKYIALASNSGQSYIINSFGKIVKMTNPNTYELLTGEIVPNKSRTWYNYIGDWPILLLSSVFFGLGVKQSLKTSQQIM